MKTIFVDARWLAQPSQGVYTYFNEIYTRLVHRAIPNLRIVFGIVPGHEPSFITSREEIVEYKSDKFIWRHCCLGNLINKIKPDFAHFQYTMPLGLNKNIKTIVALHDVIFLEHPEFFPVTYRLVRKFFFGSSARKADILLTISEKSSHDIQKHFSIGRDRINVIPLGVGSSLVSGKSKEVSELLEKRFLLAVGRHEPRKNYERLMEAYELSGVYDQNNCYLVIAGWIAKEFGLKANGGTRGVVLLTECSDSELIWLYKNAKGFIFPSIAEGYGLPLVEALEFGLPSVASNTYPIDDVLSSCVKSFDPYSISQISDCIKLISGDAQYPLVNSSLIPSWDDYVDDFVKLLSL